MALPSSRQMGATLCLRRDDVRLVGQGRQLVHLNVVSLPGTQTVLPSTTQGHS
jgi:hypothetical protein